MARLGIALATAALLTLCPGAGAVSGAHPHRFSVSQSGLPEDAASGRFLGSSTEGAGTVWVADALDPDGLQIQHASLRRPVTIRHEDVFRGARPRLELRVVDATLAAFADGSRLLTLAVRVTLSNDQMCLPGSRGTVDLHDNPRGKDVVLTSLCPLGHVHYYESSAERGRVKVVID